MKILKQPKYIDWLYSKKDCSFFQKCLRTYMLLGWSIKSLNKLKYDTK